MGVSETSQPCCSLQVLGARVCEVRNSCCACMKKPALIQSPCRLSESSLCSHGQSAGKLKFVPPFPPTALQYPPILHPEELIFPMSSPPLSRNRKQIRHGEIQKTFYISSGAFSILHIQTLGYMCSLNCKYKALSPKP